MHLLVDLLVQMRMLGAKAVDVLEHGHSVSPSAALFFGTMVI
jgi:hypothetical protein